MVCTHTTPGIPGKQIVRHVGLAYGSSSIKIVEPDNLLKVCNIAHNNLVNVAVALGATDVINVTLQQVATHNGKFICTFTGDAVIAQ